MLEQKCYVYGVSTRTRVLALFHGSEHSIWGYLATMFRKSHNGEKHFSDERAEEYLLHLVVICHQQNLFAAQGGQVAVVGRM